MKPRGLRIAPGVSFVFCGATREGSAPWRRQVQREESAPASPSGPTRGLQRLNESIHVNDIICKLSESAVNPARGRNKRSAGGPGTCWAALAVHVVTPICDGLLDPGVLVTTGWMAEYGKRGGSDMGGSRRVDGQEVRSEHGLLRCDRAGRCRRVRAGPAPGASVAAGRSSPSMTVSLRKVPRHLIASARRHLLLAPRRKSPKLDVQGAVRLTSSLARPEVSVHEQFQAHGR